MRKTIFKLLFFFILVLTCNIRLIAHVDSLSFCIQKDTSTHKFIPDTSYHHSWKKASILSACIPGVGQLYNEVGYRKTQNKKHRAWWKAPIIWGGLAVGSYYFYDYLTQAKKLKAEWLYRQDNNGQYLYNEYSTWGTDSLLDGFTTDKLDKNGNLIYDYYGNPKQVVVPGFDIAAKRRDVIGFGLIAFWGLNVVEALVDGHFVYFDVSEDLTIKTFPIMYDQYSFGMKCSFMF